MLRDRPQGLGRWRVLLAALAVCAAAGGVWAVALARDPGTGVPPAGGSSPTPRPAMTVQPGPTGPGESQLDPSGPPFVPPTEPAASDIGSPTPSSVTPGG